MTLAIDSWSLMKSVAGRNDDQNAQEGWLTTGIASSVGDTRG